VIASAIAEYLRLENLGTHAMRVQNAPCAIKNLNLVITYTAYTVLLLIKHKPNLVGRRDL
jgi:hypothetical protein